MDPRSGQGTSPWLIVFAVIAMAPGVFCPATFGQPIEWQEMNAGIEGGMVRKLVEHPDGSIFALTYYLGVGDDRIYRSRDGGLSWESIDIGAPEISVANLVVLPEGDLLASTDRRYLFRSSDRGNNWRQVSQAHAFWAGLVVHPSGVLFGADSYGTGLLKSSDEGVTWTATALNDSTLWLNDVDVTPQGTILVAGDEAGVFRSDDLGMTWTVRFQFRRINFVTVATDSSVFLVGPVPGCIHRSRDDAVSWQTVGCGAHDYSTGDADFNGVTVDDDGTIFVADWWKIYSQAPGHVGWQLRRDDHRASIATDGLQYMKGRLFAQTWGIGILVSDDEGETWARQNQGLGAASISAIRPAPDGAVYAIAYRDAVYRSDDRGAQWERLSADRDLGLEWSESLTIDSEGTVLIGQGLTFRSSDRGLTWHPLADDCWGGPLAIDPDGTLYVADYGRLYRYDESTRNCTMVTDTLYAIADIDFANNGDLLVATASGADYEGDGVFRSSDEGATWNAMPMTPFNKSIRRILVKPNGVVIAGAYRSGVFRSDDDGFSFEAVWQPPYVGYVRDFALGPVGEIYAATLGGIFRSTDDGRNWEDIGSGIPASRIASVTFDGTGYLYVGTETAGVYRSVEPIIVAAERDQPTMPRGFRSIVYPNPLVSTATLDVELEAPSNVGITIYDTVGRQIAVVVDRPFPAGRHPIHIDLGDVSSGAYYYRLETGFGVETGSLIVSR